MKTIYAFTGKVKNLRKDIKLRLKELKRIKKEAKILDMFTDELGWR